MPSISGPYPKQWDNQPERISTRMWRRSPDLVSFRYDNGDRITKAEGRYEPHPKTLCFQEILMEVAVIFTAVAVATLSTRVDFMQHHEPCDTM
jgi:hypothetical protein